MSAPILSLQIFNIPWSLLKKKPEREKTLLFDKDTEKIWLSNISSASTKHFQEPLHFCVSQTKLHRPDPLKSKLEWSWSKSGREWEVKTWWGLKSQQGVIYTDFHSGKRWKRWFSNSLWSTVWTFSGLCSSAESVSSCVAAKVVWVRWHQGKLRDLKGIRTGWWGKFIGAKQWAEREGDL